MLLSASLLSVDHLQFLLVKTTCQCAVHCVVVRCVRRVCDEGDADSWRLL